MRGVLGVSGAVVDAMRGVRGVLLPASSMRCVEGESGTVADDVQDVLGVQVPAESHNCCSLTLPPKDIDGETVPLKQELLGTTVDTPSWKFAHEFSLSMSVRESKFR